MSTKIIKSPLAQEVFLWYIITVVAVFGYSSHDSNII